MTPPHTSLGECTGRGSTPESLLRGGGREGGPEDLGPLMPEHVRVQSPSPACRPALRIEVVVGLRAMCAGAQGLTLA